MVEQWEAWRQAKRTAVEYLAVFIASMGFIFGVLGLVIGAVSAWIAYDTYQEIKVMQIRFQNHLNEDH